jgi:phage-related holin
VKSGVAFVLKGIAAGVLSLSVSVPVALQILFILSALDVVTALFSPKRSITITIRRVVMAMLLAATVFYVYALAKTQTGINVGFDLGSAVCMFYSVGEAINVAKNFSDSGVYFPPVILTLLSKAEGITGAEKAEIDALALKQEQETEALALKQERAGKQ